MRKSINTSYLTATRVLGEIVARHRDAPRFAECCRQCPGYGKSWVCPPFNYDPADRLRQFRFITLLMARVAVDGRRSIASAHDILLPVREEMHSRLLHAERTYGGYALLLAGKCHHCDALCARLHNLPCRHPDQARPSIEGWGMDVNAIAEDVFGISLEWGRDGNLPPHLTLMAALLHNDRDLSPSLIAGELTLNT